MSCKTTSAKTTSPTLSTLPFRRLTTTVSCSAQDNARREITRRIKDLGKKGKIKQAVNEVAQAARLGIPLDTQLATALVDICVRNNKLELAETFFDDLFGEFVTPDDITFCTLIRGFGNLENFEWSTIQRLLQRMRQEFDIQPSINVYNALLEVCVVQNDVDQAEAFIDQMLVEEVAPNASTLNTVKSRRSIRKLVKQLDREVSKSY